MTSLTSSRNKKHSLSTLNTLNCWSFGLRCNIHLHFGLVSSTTRCTIQKWIASLYIDTRDKWGKKSSKYVVPNLQVDTVVISLPVKTALPIKATKSLQHRGDHPLKMQVASIIQTPASVLTFEIQKVQFQKGGADCGLFAIAFATDPCYVNNYVNLFCLVE